MSGSEKNFENRIKKLLSEHGAWYVKFFANAFTQAGIPDLLVSCYGHFVGIECKAPLGRPSKLQLHNIAKIRESGGIAMVVWPDDFNHLKELLIGLRDSDHVKFSKAYDHFKEKEKKYE